MGLTLVPNWVASPAPFVDVLLEDIPAGVDTFRVRRTADRRTQLVRGMVDLPNLGGASKRDFEAPFGRPVTYQAEYFTAGISTGFSAAVSTSLYGLTGSWAWFHDPLDPRTAVKVRLLRDAAGELTRGIDSSAFAVPGRSVGITMPGMRGGLQKVVLDCFTETREEAEKLDALFGAYDDENALAIICVRSLPETWLPGTLFAFVGAPTLRRVDSLGKKAKWGLVGDETTAPAPAFITPLLTYADFTAFYDTYADFTAAYPDYLTASRDYSIASS